MLALRRCAGFLELVHCLGQTGFAKVISLIEVEPHALSVSNLLALAAPLWVYARVWAKIALDIVGHLCKLTFRIGNMLQSTDD